MSVESYVLTNAANAYFAVKTTSETLDEKSNLPQICLVQICCKYEIRKALQPVQRWRWPNSHKSEQIRPSPHFYWVQSSYLQHICTRQILCQFVFSSCETFCYHMQKWVQNYAKNIFL